MPILVEPALAACLLSDRPQPRLVVDEELTLRPWREDDVEAVRAAFACPEIQYWHTRRVDSTEEALDWIADWAGRWQAERDAGWAVVDREDRPVGQSGLRSVNLGQATADISYWVLPEYRGRGVARRVTERLVRWSFDELGLRRLQLWHSARNLASCRVAEATGFELEGTLRGAIRHTDGWHDMHLHAQLVSAPVAPFR